MLMLTRKIHERIFVTVPASDKPTVIEVELIDIDRNRSRIGFVAEPNVEIMRSELVAGKKQEPANGQ